MIESEEDALDLIESARFQLSALNDGYHDCLYAESVPKAYLIKYKNFLENLRSALDYTARGLFIRFGETKKKEPHIYFPYIPYRTLSREQYDKKKLFNKKMPGVENARPDIRDFILKLSDYDNGMEWFLGFMVITNTKKHVQLVRQIAQNDVRLKMSGIVIQASSINMLGSIKTDSGTLEGPHTLQAGVPAQLAEGGSVTPTEERYLYIEGHWQLGNAIDFAELCHRVIRDVVQRLVHDPPILK